MNSLSKEVLICDDSKYNIQILESYLQPFDFVIKTTMNGDECLEILNTNRIDIVFLDLEMPKMSGYSVIKKAKESGHHKKSLFIATTAHNSSSEKNKMLKAGFSQILEKPIVRGELFNLLKVLNLSPIDTDIEALEMRIKQRLLNKKKIFLQDKLKAIQKINDGDSKDFFKDLKIIGHQIKGTASTFGCPDLEVMGSSLEQLLENQKEVEAKHMFIDLKNKILKEIELS